MNAIMNAHDWLLAILIGVELFKLYKGRKD